MQADPQIAEATYVAGFSAVLLDPERPQPRFVSGPNGNAAKKRFDVYRNNVAVSLVKALADIFPAVRRIVGEEFFRAMALIHLRQTPPVSPLLFEYGRDFADFIERFEPAGRMPWLADVARIERAWLDAYHAAEATPLSPHALAAIPPERLLLTRFTPHPATRITRSRFPAVAIFAANRSVGEVGRITATEAEDALVTRPGLEVFVRRLPPGGAAFLTALIGGATFGDAAALALEKHAGFDLAANIAGMLDAGAFAAVKAQS
jgi:hypothetical protein